MPTSAFHFRAFLSYPSCLPSLKLLICFYHLENIPQHACQERLIARYGFFLFFWFFLRDEGLVTSPGCPFRPSSGWRRLYRLQTLPISFPPLFLALNWDWDLAQMCLAPCSLVFWFFLEGAERSACFYHPPRFGGYYGLGYYPFPWKGRTPITFLLAVSIKIPA